MKYQSIIFDIDGCLVNEKYEFTIPLEEMQKIIQEGKSKGLIFSINSNRSLESMLSIYQQLEFNWKLIGEGGAYMFDPLMRETKSLFDTEIDRLQLVNSLKDLTNNIWYGDTNNVLINPKSIATKCKNRELTIFLENTRKYTMTIYPRNVSCDTLCFDKELISNVLKTVKKAFKDYEAVPSMKYGNVLLTPKSLQKGSLLGSLPGPRASFGDTQQDISMFENSEYCGAPLNAEQKTIDKVKELRGFISTKTYTSGAYEFIKKIIVTM